MTLDVHLLLGEYSFTLTYSGLLMPKVLRSIAARDYFWLITVLLLMLLVYWPGLSGGFKFDDFGNLVDNPAFAKVTSLWEIWLAVWSSDSGPTDRPLSMLSFALQVWFTGLAPWPFKLINVLIHLVNGALVFLLTRAVLNELGHNRQGAGSSGSWLVAPDTLALLVTSAWLLSPMQVTAVLYVVQRMESLAALFVLVGLLMYWQGRMRLIRGLPGGWLRILIGLMGGTLLATLAKETGVMLPVYAFVLEWLVLRGRTANGFSSRLVLLYALVLLIPGLLGLLYTLPSAVNGTAYAARPFDLTQRLWTEGRVLVDYLHWLVLPTRNALSLYHDDIRPSTGWLTPWTTAASWALIFGLLVLAGRLRQRVPLFTLGVGWFFAGHALVSTYLPLEPVYEYRNYLPSWGVFLALFGLMFTWKSPDIERHRILRNLILIGALALITLYAGFTALRAQTWSSPLRLAYFEATSHPDSSRASYELARTMLIIAPSKDMHLFQVGMQQMEDTTKLPGASIQADQALIIMATKNHLPVRTEWWRDLQAKIAHQPLSVENMSGLFSLVQCGYNGMCAYNTTEVKELGNTLRIALALHPSDASVITLLANYEVNITRDFSQAYALMQDAVTLNPSKFSYWNNLVKMQIAANLLPQAQATLERMRELNDKGLHDSEIAEASLNLSKKLAGQVTPPSQVARWQP